MRFLFSIVLVAAASCQSVGQTRLAKELEKLSWIEGQWNRTNVREGRTAFEKWVVESPGKLSGLGITLRGADTVFVEKLAIVLEAGDVYYVADVPENPNPIKFRFTELNDGGFVCENPQHDFPKRIAYVLSGDNLKATISDSTKSIDYLFVRGKE